MNGTPVCIFSEVSLIRKWSLLENPHVKDGQVIIMADASKQITIGALHFIPSQILWMYKNSSRGQRCLKVQEPTNQGADLISAD